jgi:hypothetical protein
MSEPRGVQTGKGLFGFNKIDTAYVLFAVTALVSIVGWILGLVGRVNDLERDKYYQGIALTKLESQQNSHYAELKEQQAKQYTELNTKLDQALIYIYTKRKE